MRTDTYKFKTVAGIDLFADVCLPRGDGPWPVVVSLHGGALIVGSRTWLPGSLLDKLIAAGVAVVSPDYRLAPETRLPDIWSDVEDLFAWVRERGPGLFRADPLRIGVHGISAGGYLALLSGCRLRPRPKVVGSFAGYGDITAPWYSEPDPWYCGQPGVPEKKARAMVGHGYPSDDRTGYNRGAFYVFLRQNGLWPEEVGGMEPEALREFCPVFHVSPAFPPAVLYHGTADHDVPFTESERFVSALEKHGVQHRFLPLQDVDHVHKGASPEDVERIEQSTADFMLSHLGQE